MFIISTWIILLWSLGAMVGAYWCLRLIILRFNIKDIPNSRSSHTHPTPTSGGISVAIPFLLSIAMYETLFQFSPPYVTALLTGGLLMSIKGLWDDIKGLGWKVRLSLQCAVTIFVVMSGVYFNSIELPIIGEIPLAYFGPLLSILGVVTFINLFNFIDGLNGLSTGSSLIGLFFYSAIMREYLHPPVHAGYYTFFCAMVLMFSLIPLFLYNFPKGKVFLGDAGSQFLGFVLPVLGMLGTYETQKNGIVNLEFCSLTPLVMPLLFFHVIYDGIFTLLRRIKFRKKLWHADKEHLFHKCVEAGLTSVQVSLLYFFFGTLQGILAFIFTFYVASQFFILSFVPFVIVYYIFSSYILLRIKSHSRKLSKYA